ncbi:glycosyltransferase [Brevibacterium sp. BRM-1]|uniref:glycosyltransferase n=1 Tax=Brevibacterium sp. BRM-1 TaxID=2999062 RepID=UPI002281D4DB|nr:glycosyltransferase [Brevibacterium sp. BRM-1]WAL40563.1 glycosyltransferase [Brevibacterium sp. BRM-1]
MGAICAVVPACNEEDHIGACLAALDTARRVLAVEAPGWSSHVVVVLDACTDATEEIVRQHPGVQAIRVQERCAGAARAAGAAAALDGPAAAPRPGPVPQQAAVPQQRQTPPQAKAAAAPAPELWLACTDADSTVPATWLVDHVRAAQAGWDARVGTVEPLLGEDFTAADAQRWASQHTLGPGHPHVFGANLGISAHAYRAVGGFAPLHVGEDVDIVERIRARGLPVQATAEAPVTTSARPRSRVAGGFASYLARLSVQ